MNQKSNWLPKKEITSYAYQIEGPLTVARRTYESMLQVQSNPYMWAESTISHLISIYRKQLNRIPEHRQQLNRWQNKKKKRLTFDQLNELKRLQNQLECLDTVIHDILSLAEDWKKRWKREINH